MATYLVYNQYLYCLLYTSVGGSPFTVAKDGLYYVAFNKADNQLTVIPTDFGIIGDA